ncbi:MAG TPA: DUF177 domain-containing protein, partial [Paracoccus sp.]|nr:DUF177 domain-containing protein [Paracoccus sp. (in: a-proteobacteria)]
MPDTPANTSANPPASQPLAGASLPLRVADLPTRRPQPFHLRPGPEARARIIEDLGITGLRKLDFRGTLQAEGRHDWRLEGRLGATVVQPCVITAEPVTTRIDTDVLRRFLRELPEPVGAETEMPEDDTLEPLGPVIDPGAVMVEALAIALPDYPRAPDAELGEAGSAPPGAA